AYVKNEPVMYDDPTGHFFNFVAAAVGAAIGAGIEMARDAAKGQLSKSNWKNYAGAAAAGAITGLTAGLTGGASLVANMGVRAGAGYASSAAEQYITTGKVNQKQALTSSVQSVGTYGAGKATNKLKVSSGGRGNTYQTYTKKNSTTGQVYTGRTSGKGTPLENIAKRDANHHMNQQGFGRATLDQTSSNKNAIRGREQQMIEKNGGARSQGGTSGNSINGISKNNNNRKIYINAANKEFGKP
ncbi:hypothetical protein ACFOQM_16195, partial [Paenibacillus sp. GCM10012307]|nr:hypothetical protein [Paenibacillus roseus]